MYIYTYLIMNIYTVCEHFITCLYRNLLVDFTLT